MLDISALGETNIVSRFMRVGLALILALGGATVSAAPNKLPTVSLTAPSSGATFAAPAAIALSASASDPDGKIAKVEFYFGATLIATRTTSPYTMTWSNVPGGSYSLTAQATDDRGGTKTSAAVSISVTGPKLLIVTPANGAAVYGSAVVVNGSFYGDSNTTVLVDNGNTTRLATLDGITYTTTIPLHVGPNTLRVVASRRDRTSDQATVNVTGNGNPLLVFTAPTTSVFDAPANVNLTVDAVSPAGAISKVDFYRNGTLLGTSTSPPYQHAWNDVPAGSYTVSAIATDALGVTGSTTLAIAVNGSNIPPVVALTSPAHGATFSAPANIVMTANATDADGSVTLLEFLKNGVVVGSTNVAPYIVTWNNVAAGSYSLTARATDNRSAVTTSAPVIVTVTPPNSPPTVALASPVPGASFVAPATIPLSATASDSDGAVAKIDYFAGSTLVGTATATPYSATWSGVAAGTYALTARATDNGGAIATSAPVSVTVNSNSPPTVTLTSPAPGASFQAPAAISFVADAADSDGTIVRVEFFQGSTLIGTAIAAPYTYNWTNVPTGSYAITARAMDDRGAVGVSASVTVSVYAPYTPALAILSPASGATIDGDSVTVSGTVDAPANSGVTVNGVVAAIDATGHFYANNVPLAGGANTISVTLTTLAGLTTTQSINVTSTGPAPVRITASPTQGLSPLNVVFNVLPAAGITIRKVEIDVGGTGTFDQTLLAEPWTLEAIYSGTGTVLSRARVTDAQGLVQTATIPIVLVDSATLDQDLRAVWSGMTSALAAGDKPTALRYLDASAQEKYGPVFDALLPNMPQIVSSFSAPQSVSLADGLGEYAVNRTIDGQNRLFLIYFGRNGDGVWRLGSM